RQVGFQIAPRLNAAGRMDTAQTVIELFLTSDGGRARELAQQLHDQNAERQQVEAGIREACEQAVVDDRAVALVYYAEDWHRGVLGIVASRMVEQLHRPVFVLSRNPEDGLAQGSGRSIPGFHLLEALESMADLFVRFGGHQHAAGVTLAADRIEEFRCRFNSYAASRLTPEDLRRELRIDAVIGFPEIADRSVAEIFQLAPFGNGNPAPLFAVLNAEVAAAPVLWKEKHLRVMLRQEGRSLALKAWNFAGRAPELVAGTRVDAVFSLEEDPYSASQGYPGWAAILRDVRAAETARQAAGA
ncbi:MAG TPA: DHHA1 domain-containing protein, partial [Bryobacteraceae bacterium]|nr:DHHA1 domain-containing protein [Bryobacteraceae bacterium]